jgi:hypothetical protein
LAIDHEVPPRLRATAEEVFWFLAAVAGNCERCAISAQEDGVGGEE